MANKSYHGTNKASIIDIIGPPSKIDVTRGKGELGQGFYTGSSIAIAAIWAQNRFSTDGVVIEINIPKADFVKLSGHIIKKRTGVFVIWSKLKKLKTTTTHIYGYDYIIAPFATIEGTGHQLKFESKRAEILLRSSAKKLFPCA